MNLYVMRHGITDSNLTKKFNGHFEKLGIKKW